MIRYPAIPGRPVQGGLCEGWVPPVHQASGPSYAARPGTGPEGETCGTCRHLVRFQPGRRVYRKCQLTSANWTNGYATDVRAKAAACEKWEANP